MPDHSPCFEAISGLRSLPETLYQRLLAPHAVALASAGVDPIAADPGALWAARNQLPVGLVDAIHRIHDMSDDAGYDQLLHAAGGPLFVAESGVLPTVAIAARVLLDQPESFNRAHGRRFVEALRKFREFPGRLPVAPTLADSAIEQAQERFGAFFHRRGRSALCRIRPWRERDNLHFLVSHGRCYRTDDAVYETGGVCTEQTLVWRPQQHDLVVLDTRTGRLRVSAPDAHTLHEYVSGFGQLLFGDPCWFVDGAVVSLDPLIHARNEVLQPTRGLLEVSLVELIASSRTEGLETKTLRGANIARYLDINRVDPAAEGPLVQAKLRLRSQQTGRWRTVTIGVPDLVTGDWRNDGGVARRYLEERGFLAGPPKAPASEVA
jgi:hypothetical protein